MLPNREMWLGAFPDQPLDAGEMFMIGKGDADLYFFVNVVYQDTLTGDRHHSQVCYFVRGSVENDFAPCPTFNDYN